MKTFPNLMKMVHSQILKYCMTHIKLNASANLQAPFRSIGSHQESVGYIPGHSHSENLISSINKRWMKNKEITIGCYPFTRLSLRCR